MNAITTTTGDAVSTTPLMSFLERIAKDPQFDVDKFEVLLRLQREVAHDQARREFNAGMAAAQAEMLPVVRDASNKHLGNRYAKLEQIDGALRPIYTKHGFSVRFGSAPAPAEGWLRIVCTVAHAGGYWEENHLDAPVSTTGSQGGKMAVTAVQAIGSTVTYLRRYLLLMVFNVALADEQDDDGVAARMQPASSRQSPPGPRVDQVTGQEYPFATGNGGQIYRTSAEWMERWRRLIEACRLTDALDKLAKAAEMNQSMITAVSAHDPEAAAEVCEMLAAALPPEEPSEPPAEGSAPGEKQQPDEMTDAELHMP